MTDERRILLRFVTKYFTQWGENVVVTGAGVVLGNWDPRRAHRAACHHAGKDLVWEALVPISPVSEITYRCAVVNEASEIVKWAQHTHTVPLPCGIEDGAIVEIYDEWTDSSHPGTLLSSGAFRRIMLPDAPAVGRLPPPIQPSPNEALVRFRVFDWEVQAGQEVCVSGNTPQLGNWQASWQQVLRMTQTSPSCWEAEVVVPLTALPIVYKYAVGEIGGELTLEQGESRIVGLPSTETTRAPAAFILHDGYLRREQRWRAAGVAVPVFALRTLRSVGCGEFADVADAARWCGKVGFKLLQLLPVSDTAVTKTWRDSYPYSSLCVFALHPMYLCLEGLASPLPPGVAQDIESARAALDAIDVDYEGVMSAKLRISRLVFDQVGNKDLGSNEYREFYTANKEWLRPYAAFCFLRDLFGTAEHWQWGAFATPTPGGLARLTSPNAEWYSTIQYHCWLQYHLHGQLAAAAAAAAAVHVVLKGDLPIGVDKRSVDTWLYPRLFRMDASTGAPPDAFDPFGGQNWGFPTYNWEEMAADEFGWWRRRLGHMSQYFSAYRIDHILGFFRIWELPGDSKSGLLGRFRPSIPIRRAELEGRGIWDFDRLCNPYVTHSLLEKTFGEGEPAADVAARYFVDGPGRRYRFRSQYASEAALWNLRPRPGLLPEVAEEAQRIWKGLLALRQNVVLLRDAGDGDLFYPRFDLMSTSSFRELESYWREELARLHDDYFHHGRSDVIWRAHALRTLPALQSASEMLVCGEDLGMVPACVHPVMDELGIVSLRIQRMPSTGGVEFDDPLSYPYMAVASPSSHDTTPLRAWFQEDPARQERFQHFLVERGYLHNDDSTAKLSETGAKPAGNKDADAQTSVPELVSTVDLVKAVIQQHLESPCVLAIFPLQDIMALSPSLSQRAAEEETINNPADPEHYWRYRMHVNIEDLGQDEVLTAILPEMLLVSGRIQKHEFDVTDGQIVTNGGI